MNREKIKLDQVLHPKTGRILFLVITTVILLIYSQGFTGAFQPVCYFSYLYSAYTLVVVILNIKKFYRFLRKKIIAGQLFVKVRDRLCKVETIDRYFHDKRFKSQIHLYLSVGINGIFIVIKLREGIRYHSLWFISFAVYYILLIMIRFFLLTQFRKKYDMVYEYRVYRSVGCFLMILNLVLTGIIIQTIVKNVATVYKGNVIYASALYSFYLIITAIVNIVKYRKYHSPILSSVKVINLFTACVSILMLQTTMIATFGTAGGHFMRLMNTITGICEVTIILLISTFMIIHGTREIR